jgi:hypothetical protein
VKFSKFISSSSYRPLFEAGMSGEPDFGIRPKDRDVAAPLPVSPQIAVTPALARGSCTPFRYGVAARQHKVPAHTTGITAQVATQTWLQG